MTEEEVRALSESDLADLVTLVSAEANRRQLIQRENELLAETQQAVQDASGGGGRPDGEEWSQPTGVHDAYLLESTVVHNGKTWESLTPYNVWEPGVSGWREVVLGSGTAPEFVQPTGAHDAYAMGDEVMFEGKRYVSTMDGNVWSPTAYPGGWTLVA